MLVERRSRESGAAYGRGLGSAVNHRDWADVCRRSVQGEVADCTGAFAPELRGVAGRLVIRSASTAARDA